MKPVKYLVLITCISSLTANAKVNSCIFDGGGSVDERACGSDRAVEIIQKKYKGSDDVQILSGSGNNADTSCMAPTLKCDSEGKNCGAPYTTSSWDSKSKSMTKTQIRVPKTGKIKGHLSPGTKESFQNSCLKDSGPKDVCHMWSINHGAPAGVVAFNPNKGKDEYITNDDIRAKADKCGTFRYFTQSCYGSQMGAVIFDENKKLIPGRCGIGASQAGVVAPGMLVDDGSSASDLKVVGGQHDLKAKVKTPDVRYPMLEMMDKDKHKSIGGFYDQNRDSTTFNDKSSKDKNGKIQEGDSIGANTDYYLSSDYYLDERFGKKFKSAGDTSSINYLVEREAMLDEAKTQDLEANSLFDHCSFSAYSTGHGKASELNEELNHVLGIMLPGHKLSDEDKKAVEADLRNEYMLLAASIEKSCQAIRQSDIAIKIQYQLWIDAAKTPEEKRNLQAKLEEKVKNNDKCDFNKIMTDYKSQRKKVAAEYKEVKKKEEEEIKKQLDFCAANNMTQMDPVDQKPKCMDLESYDRNLRVWLKTNCHIAGGPQKVTILSAEVWTPDQCENPKGRERIKLRNQLREQGMAVAAAKGNSIQLEAMIEGFLNQPVSLEMRSYESQQMRFNRILNLYRKGKPEDVHDYQMLKQCENGDINSPVKMKEPDPRFVSGKK
ncbi:MAG TPA: hypothetical protein VNJ08_09560 [Bacteriovoracaceae bacterium]|nr:hypothetical protein [Bacteriovoracaceae bacterium]